MEKNTDWMPSTNCVVILCQVLLESIRISCFYDIHAHPVQCLDGFVYGTIFFVIMLVIEPETTIER